VPTNFFGGIVTATRLLYYDAYGKVFRYKRYESVKELYSYFVAICLSTTSMTIMRWSFYSRMVGRNKYLNCLFALDDTFKNYIMDKYHLVSTFAARCYA